MSDLTDEELRACFEGGAHDKRAMRMAVEILRHRAAVRADRERVMAVVRHAVQDIGIKQHLGIFLRQDTQRDAVEEISGCVADALASPARMQIDTTKLLSSTTEAELANISTLSQMEIYDALHRGRMERIHAEDADRQRNARHYARDESTGSPTPALTAERVRSVVREDTLSVLEDQYATVVRDGSVLLNGTKERRNALEFCADVIADRTAERLAGAQSSVCTDADCPDADAHRKAP